MKGWLPLPLAMLAMHDGGLPLTRQACLSLLRRDPFHLETYARLLWIFLPIRMKHVRGCYGIGIGVGLWVLPTMRCTETAFGTRESHASLI